jgi:acetyl esterase
MIHPDLHRFLADWDAAWATLPAGAGPAQRRAHFELCGRRHARAASREASARDEHLVAGARDRHAPCACATFRPAEHAAGTLPALIYLHGGAWMQGSPETHWDITAGIAAAEPAESSSAWTTHWRPSTRFPRALHECTGSGALGIRSIWPRAGHAIADAIAIGGDSAGGNLAAAATLVLRGSAYRRRARSCWSTPPPSFNARPAHRTARTPTARWSPWRPCRCSQRHVQPRPGEPALHAAVCRPMRAGRVPRPPATRPTSRWPQHDPLRDEGVAYARGPAGRLAHPPWNSTGVKA